MKNILIKSVAIGLLLLYVQAQQWSVFSVSVFLFFALLFYVQPIFHTSSLLPSFLSFSVLALIIPSRFAGVFPPVVFAAVFAALYCLVMGVKNMALIRRREWYYVLFLGITYVGSFLFFTAPPSMDFWLKSLIFFVFGVSMLREFLRFHEIGLRRFHKLGVFVVALIELECLWAVGLLPLGFANSASLMTVLIVTLSELASRYMRGTLTARFIRLSSLFLLAVVLVIFVFSQLKL